MSVKRIWRFAIMPVLLCIVVAIAVVSYNSEKNSCMGVRILSEAEMSRFVSCEQKELSGWIKLNGDNAAVDAGTFTVYISQNIKENTQYAGLTGSLDITLAGHKMFFAPDEMFADLDTAMAENHRFELYIEDEAGTYSLYSVIFTNLPVVRMSGQRIYTDPDGIGVYSGDITLWDTDYAGTGGAVTEKTSAQWQNSDLRDRWEEKPTWKISLLNENGGAAMLNLMGLGSDDDWVFNSMWGDSTKIREKLMAYLWNGMSADISDTAKIPEGEYAEVICNGEYCGLYAVSRRTDQKYLDLDSDDLLLRDKKDRRGSYVQNNYSIVHGYYTEEQAWQIAEPFHKKENLTMVDVDKWIDANIMSNIVCSNGKRDYTEMYYIWKNASSNPSLKTVPITEDAIFGIKLRNEKYLFDDDEVCRDIVYRDEYPGLKELYPDLDERIAERYSLLRGGILSEETINAVIDNANSRLARGSALTRDINRWNTENKDDVTDLKAYIKARLEYMDGCYSTEIK